MFYRKKECPVFDIYKENAALQRGGKRFFDKAETGLPLQFRIDRLRDEMGKYRVNFFHILIIALLLAGVAGCGYKKPPYYPAERETGSQS